MLKKLSLPVRFLLGAARLAIFLAGGAFLIGVLLFGAAAYLVARATRKGGRGRVGIELGMALAAVVAAQAQARAASKAAEQETPAPAGKVPAE